MEGLDPEHGGAARAELTSRMPLYALISRDSTVMSPNFPFFALPFSSPCPWPAQPSPPGHPGEDRARRGRAARRARERRPGRARRRWLGWSGAAWHACGRPTRQLRLREDPLDAAVPEGLAPADPVGLPKGSAWAPYVDYGYSDEVMLLVELTPPAGALPGPVAIRGDAEWLVCKDICIPEKAHARARPHGGRRRGGRHGRRSPLRQGTLEAARGARR